MNEMSSLPLGLWDYCAFGAFFVILSVIGYLAGRKERSGLNEYFLAGRKLPWYVVGCSFIASNISSEHFIGMIGAAFIYGTCVCMYSWANIGSFSFLVWFFIPFLLASKVFTIPEFLEHRFNTTLRQIFAIVTVISNVVAFLAAVLYGGGLALQRLFGWPLWPAIILLGTVAGVWAIYGGLSSVAWTDFFTVIIMMFGGVIVAILGLKMLAVDSGSFIDGFNVMLERNQANEGTWAEAVAHTSRQIAHTDEYNRLSLFQPIAHELVPWPYWIFGVFSVSIWYNVMNQFMIQRVLGAKNIYHARMGIILAGFMQIFLPIIIVMPGLVLFARYPEVLLLPWEQIRPEADKAYIGMVQMLIPIGLRGIILAAIFGAIQSTVNSVLNSTATIITLDIYKRIIHPEATDRHLVKVGIGTSVVVLLIAICLGGFINKLGGSLFVYIQTLYSFFSPPFAAIFLLGIFWRRINGYGATAAVVLGFIFGIAMKIYIQLFPSHPVWIEPFGNQAAINWIFCMLVCITVSLKTPLPASERVNDKLVFNWTNIDNFKELGLKWYNNVVFWWSIFALLIITLLVIFSGLIF